MSINGGAEKMTALLANEFIRRYNVVIVSLWYKNNCVIYKLNEKVKEVVLLDTERRLRYSLPLVCCKMLYILHKYHADLCMAIDSSIYFLIPVAKLLGIPVIACEHSNLQNRDRNNFLYYILRWISTKLSHKIITLTRRDKLAYIEKFHISEKKVDYIYNFLADYKFKVKDYKMDSNIIISMGRFDRIKGYDLLVEVARIVFSLHSDWQWHIYGTGSREYIEEIRKKINEYGLQTKLIIKGYEENVKKIYESAGIFVLTSYNEGLPMVLLEAKSYSLPIVAFDCPTGPGEIVENEKSGYLVKCYDVESMANKIINLIENKNIRKTFSYNAQDNMEKFAKEEIIKKWFCLIDNI